MKEYFIYYTESNAVCLIIFGIMLIRDLLNVDRQEKQIKYDYALGAFMLYFISDAVWAAIIAGVIPRTLLSVVLANFANFIFMAALTYCWLNYVLSFEQAPHRERPINRFAVLFPLLVSSAALVLTYFVSPRALITEELATTAFFNAFQIAVPIIYIIAVLFYTMRKAVKERNRSNRRRHLFIGLFPLTVVAGGLLQVMVLKSTPVFCFSCTILMLIFYIQSMDDRISVDPLTLLNNRGQLMRYISQNSGEHRDGRLTFVIMLDVNDFKAVNDTFGHPEGDRALMLIADALRTVTRNHTMPFFLGRYGGDEFVMVVHPEREEEMSGLIHEIREQIEACCRKEKTPYTISIGAGYDEFLGGQDSLQKCIQRADRKLYLDKEYCKLHGQTSVCGKSA